MSGTALLRRCSCRGTVLSWRRSSLLPASHARNLSFNEAVEKRNHLFTLEKKKQAELVGRIEKIEVRYMGIPKDTTLILNKDISTPFDCARHLSNIHVDRSALALIDGNTIWDMHRPLTQSCSIELLHYLVPETQQVNKAFWRTCSFVLGAAISRAFKDNFQIKLHSFPSPDIRSGSFVYDAELCGLSDWIPKMEECRVLSSEFVKIIQSGTHLERLTVSKDLALEMFAENEHKSKQIPDIAKKNEGDVVLYRTGNHIDISKGPMIGNVKQIGRVTIPAVHLLTSPNGDRTLHRFQGVALPVGIIINHVAYNILEERAKRMNRAQSPFEPFNVEYDDHQISQAIA